ncbi:MAG: glycosyltransferase family 4 protein [Patescibacteria group bacterium]|nr:glycosyltransferase family 4 protein [Patescibacteria group bacterium]
MKIAINLTRDNVGGIIASNMNLLGYLYKLDNEFLGIELTNKMYMKSPVLFRHFSPEIFDHHIINIHHLNFKKLIKQSKNIKGLEYFYREPIKVLRNIFKEFKPDIILLSGTYYFPWIMSIAAKKEKIPIVLWYSGVLLKETEHFPKHSKKIFLSMEKSMIKNAVKIIFPSNLCKTTVEDLVIKKKIKNAYIIPNPVSNIFTNPSVVDFSIERRMAAVGRYTAVKNFDKFFELHRELKKRKWNHTASFVTNQNANLKSMPKTIDFLPPMTPEGLKNFYLSQGLIVCPSIFETFGNVPVEAACLGIPVLVSDKMGCAEIFKKVGLENMVISFDDISAVADRVEELCGQSILPKQINALKRILDNNLISEEIKAILNSSVKIK